VTVDAQPGAAAPWPGPTSPRLRDEDRLALLAETGLMDSPADETFDRFTRLVTRLLGVPVSLVSLVDDHRQFFKSAIGVDEPWASRRETPLSHSFCQFVVADDAPVVIGDARGNVRVCDSPAIEEFEVGAYAGVPLRTPEGVPLGSLCAIDKEPRQWTEDELASLDDLAAAASNEISLRLAAVRQRAFSANASHQLRTPLTALRIQLEELVYDADDPDEVRTAVGRLVDEVDRLSDTVTTLLEMARRGRFGHERRVDLAHLVRGVAARWQPLARQQGREVALGSIAAVEELVPVAAFTQIVEVLVDNALDHGRGTITLGLQEAGTHVRLTVQDEGEGLLPEAAARLFERDERGERSSGEGIGLSLADEIARRVGGRLVLLPGAPTTFELLLPRR
jgi:signal transduction histidine kinase